MCFRPPPPQAESKEVNSNTAKIDVLFIRVLQKKMCGSWEIQAHGRDYYPGFLSSLAYRQGLSAF